jgi:hypothetical protein
MRTHDIIDAVRADIQSAASLAQLLFVLRKHRHIIRDFPLEVRVCGRGKGEGEGYLVRTALSTGMGCSILLA